MYKTTNLLINKLYNVRFLFYNKIILIQFLLRTPNNFFRKIIKKKKIVTWHLRPSTGDGFFNFTTIQNN